MSLMHSKYKSFVITNWCIRVYYFLMIKNGAKEQIKAETPNHVRIAVVKIGTFQVTCLYII